MKRTLALFLLLIIGMAPSLAAPTKNADIKKKLTNNGIVQLDTPPDLPYMPPFPGAVYQQINSRPNAQDGPGFNMTFHTSMATPDVLSFYKDAFKRNSWVMMGGASDRSMAAMRKGTMFNVTCMRPYVKGYSTQVTIGYKIYSQQLNEQKQ
jgi:hypothetical protein